MDAIDSSTCAGRALAVAALLLLGACAQGSTTRSDASSAGDVDREGFDNVAGSRAPSSPIPGGVVPQTPGCSPVCEDFPAAPILEPGVPGDAAQRFGEPDDFGSSGPCVLEPALSEGDRPGALLPSNWLRPRFRFEPLAGETLWEIRLQSPREANDLVVYTQDTTWTLPEEIWEGLSLHSRDVPITVTIRGVGGGGGQPSGTRGDFQIAPVEARGNLVYWATTSSEVEPNSSKLVGFSVGDEWVVDALTIPDVGDRQIKSEGGRNLRSGYEVPEGHVQCIGCHVSTPDGEAVAFTDHWPWNNVLARIEEGVAGQRPDYLTNGGELLLNQPWLGMQTFSPAHWSDNERIVVTAYTPRSNGRDMGFSDGASYPSSSDRLAWFDLASAASFEADQTQGDVQQQLNDQIQGELGRSIGLLALDGESRSVAAPDWSHDGGRIVYTSADRTQDGRLSTNNGEVDLHVVPYNAGKGGAVEPVAGASQPGVAEYYPAFSADDSLIAFNRVAQIDNEMIYYRPDGEVYVVPAGGGEPLRLAANDPPACTGERSPGVINSWPKWSPSVASASQSSDELGKPPRSFYFLIFSSARAYPGQFDLPKTQYSPPDTRSSQLYMTAVVRDESTGQLTSYPAVYLWNQEPETSNLTPAWDEFKIPPVTPPD
ncbi:MAG: hypothetical protein OXT09_01030 [Myxococcales bacterium]|nr:hypothetical protein [Myxococcales bacterium]